MGLTETGKEVSVQLIWNKRAAETLAAAGHDVTVYVVSAFDGVPPSKTKFDKTVRGKE
jgi:hypothetical protein